VKIKINRQALISKLNHVTKALPAKTTLPILLGVKLVANEFGIFLTGSSLDITISTSIPLAIATEKENLQLIEIEEAGEIVIPGKYFFEITKKLTADIIEINTFDDTDVLICGDSGEYTLKGLPAPDYPQIELSNVVHSFAISTAKLKAIINQTTFAVAVNEARPTLTGVQFKYANGVLACTATDSFRLSQRTITLEDPKLSEFKMTIPATSLAELAKTIELADAQTMVHVTSNQVLFENAKTSFQSRLLEGLYPDVDTFIPTSFEVKLVVAYRELFNAVDRVSLMARENRASVAKITVLPEENCIMIKSHSSEIGKIEETVKIKEHNGSKFSIAFSALFLLDSLRAFENDDHDVTFGFNGDMKPFVILDNQDDANLQLIVPVRLED